MGLAVALWDGPGHVLAGVCKESPAPLGAGTAATRHQPEPHPRRKRGHLGTVGKLLEIWVKKAVSPNKVGMRNPIGAGSRLSSGRAGTSCGSCHESSRPCSSLRVLLGQAWPPSLWRVVEFLA